MADKDADEPSLELPSLGLRRRRAKRRTEPAEAAEPTVDEGPRPSEAAEDDARTRRLEAVPDSAPTPAPAPAATPDPPPQAATTAPTTATTPAASAPRLEVAPAPAPAAASPAPPAPGDRKAARPRREVSLPRIGGFPSSILTGALVGVITVGLTWGGFRLCEFVRGTSSCGDPGFLLLLAILAAMVLLGSSLLRAWGLPDPGSTSFLGVGLLAVMVLLFLVQAIFSWWMVIVIPAVAAASFALAHWVTTFVGDAE